MKRRSFLQFLGLAPAAPVAAKVAANLPAVAPVSQAITPTAIRATASQFAAAGAMFATLTVSVCSYETCTVMDTESVLGEYLEE